MFASETVLGLILVSSNAVAVSGPARVGSRFELLANDDLGTTNWSTYGDVVAARTNVTLAVTSTNEARFFQVKTVE